MARRVARNKGQVQAVLAVGAVFIVLLLGLLLFKPASPPTPAKLMHQVLLQLEQADEYAIIIEESAPEYELLFQGKVERETNLTGTLPKYELEVFHAGNGIYVRRPGEDEWEEARELKSLTGFLISPVELLRTQTANFRSAAEGQDLNLNGELCRTVYLDLTREEQLIKKLFPQINDVAIQSVSLGVALREPDFAIKQLRILVEFSDAGYLERAYYLD